MGAGWMGIEASNGELCGKRLGMHRAWGTSRSQWRPVGNQCRGWSAHHYRRSHPGAAHSPGGSDTGKSRRS